MTIFKVCAPKKEEISPIYVKNWFFNPYYKDFSMILATNLEIFGHYWEILGPFLGHVFGGSWDMVTNFRSI
jgi:hypothetical protein